MPEIHRENLGSGFGVIEWLLPEADGGQLIDSVSDSLPVQIEWQNP